MLLDGVPIGTKKFMDSSNFCERIECDWFGVTRVVPPAQAAVAVLAESVMRHLDCVLDAEHVRSLGVNDFPYAAWSPTLRLLLADRTPLHDLAALRRAVAAVARGKASPAEAAHYYQSSVGRRLWGFGMPKVAAPNGIIAPLVFATMCDVGKRAVVLRHDDADRIVKWARDRSETQGEFSFSVSDSKLQPWLRTLLRRRLPDRPVLEQEPSNSRRCSN